MEYDWRRTYNNVVSSSKKSVYYFMRLGHEEYMTEPAKVGPRLMPDNFD